MPKPYTKPKAPSFEDLAQADILADTARAVVEALRPTMADNRDRYVRTLQRHEIEAIAVGAVGAYIASRLKREAVAAELNDPVSDLWQA